MSTVLSRASDVSTTANLREGSRTAEPPFGLLLWNIRCRSPPGRVGDVRPVSLSLSCLSVAGRPRDPAGRRARWSANPTRPAQRGLTRPPRGAPVSTSNTVTPVVPLRPSRLPSVRECEAGIPGGGPAQAFARTLGAAGCRSARSRVSSASPATPRRRGQALARRPRAPALRLPAIGYSSTTAPSEVLRRWNLPPSRPKAKLQSRCHRR